MNRWKPFIGGSPYLVHSPPGPRNGGMPLSTDIPAPVNAIAYRAARIVFAASRISSSLALSLAFAIGNRPQPATHEMNVNAYADSPAASARIVNEPETTDSFATRLYIR